MSIDLDEFFVSYMSGSLPVLSRFAFTALADKGLENMVKRHGHKLYELRLDRFHGLSVFDLCPALNVLEFSAFAWVSPVSSFLHPIVHGHVRISHPLASFLTKNTCP